ncbi:DUF2333 domain-containing protein [Sulfidibacter corallicola]|uniref:DUF2333 family protein n=1 Tax=Sulfidibacter corallicola TaxID=2818388 RepID=A0A8A4TXT3_SULCO|nr:DUF2333 family protein [Sulfidibacter corallicola]QTD54031.1 DUF2333 family protein [Sulfidibacter corallicola]
MSQAVVNGLKRAGKGVGSGLSVAGKKIFSILPRGAAGAKLLVLILALLLVAGFAVGWYWSRAPKQFDVRANAAQMAGQQAGLVTGSVTTSTLIQVTDTLLRKPGGYLSNDISPPSVFLDDMPSWEFGVLVQVRDLSRSLRNDLTRSRSQSLENAELAQAEPLFNYDNRSWMLPSSESQYRKGVAEMRNFLRKLSEQNHQDAQFYARADNLRDYLSIVEKRLGSLSQRLSAAVGPSRVNVDLGGDRQATQSTQVPESQVHKTPWLQVDNVFFEARGSCWALIHFLRAIEVDFADVLEDKNAKVLVQQIVRELEATQQTVWSPMILNGSGFGFFANHSLVMASYVSRANAGLIDLRSLLTDG